MISILYYTNNLLPSKILENTILAVNSTCLKNNCELIITSHYPITKNYEEIDITESKEDRLFTGKINLETKEARLAHIYKHLVKDLSFNLDSKHKAYVVGKLPYTHKSIYKQILLSLSKAQGDSIVFMEHDCFYPESYIEAVHKAMKHYNFGYCQKNCCYLDFEGFFKTDTEFMLSGCSGKKDILTNIFSKKLELLNTNKPYDFEPIINTASNDFRDKYPEEIIASNSVCIDQFLPPNHDILDIKHKLNQGGQLFVLKRHPGALQNFVKIENHPYWGNSNKFMDMMQIDIDRNTAEECIIGTKYF